VERPWLRQRTWRRSTTDLSAEARLRGTRGEARRRGRSSGVTTVITKALRAGTSICESALRASRSPSASSSVGASAAPIRHRFAGICVNTIDDEADAPRDDGSSELRHCAQRPVQKKNAPAAVSDNAEALEQPQRKQRVHDQAPANESRLNRPASRHTIPRDRPSGAAGLVSSTCASEVADTGPTPRRRPRRRARTSPAKPRASTRRRARQAIPAPPRRARRWRRNSEPAKLYGRTPTCAHPPAPPRRAACGRAAGNAHVAAARVSVPTNAR